ncbi:hypothetical protein R6Q57_019615, partial [Mikania cordata]
KLDADRLDISKLKQLLSDKESHYRAVKSRIDEITLELNQVKTELTKTKDDECSLSKRINGLGYSEAEHPFNHNYSSMPTFNKFFDDSISKLDFGHEFLIDSNKLVSLTIDPNLKDMNCFDDSEICAENLSTSNQVDEQLERRARKRTNYPVVLNNSKFFVSKIDYVGNFKTINIKPNEMIPNFKT